MINNENIICVNWDERKVKWIKSVEELYRLIDSLILVKLINEDFYIKTEKKEVTLAEDYLGIYKILSYYIEVDNFDILLNPVGSIILGGYGMVEMILPLKTVHFIMLEWNKWKIVKGIGNGRKYIDLNRENSTALFQEILMPK